MNNANPLYTNSAPFNFSDQPPVFDPTFAMNNGALNTNGIDPSSFQNLPFGASRGPSPGFQHPNFSTNSVVPAKRPRPGEDSMTQSPRMPQAAFNNSRSQTPQQPNFPGNFPGQPGQQFQPQNSWQHLQQSSQPSPSPVMQNQPFRTPATQPQRGQTNSPAQFPPQGMQDPNNMNRMNTPSNPMMPGAMRGMPFAPNQMSMPGQSPMQFPTNHQGQQGMNLMAMQQRQYQARLQEAQQALQRQQSTPNAMDPANRAAMMNRMNGTPQPTPPGANQPQAAAQNARHMQQTTQFQQRYASYCQKQGFTPDQNLSRLGGKISNHYVLFLQAMKLGILAPGPNRANWALLANSLGAQDPSVAQEIKNIFENQGLFSFSSGWMHMMQQKQKETRSQAQPGMPAPGQSQQSPTPPQGAFPQAGGTPGPQPPMGLAAQPPPGMQHSTPQSRHASIPEQNGVSTPAESHFKSQSPMPLASPSVRQPSVPHQLAEQPSMEMAKSPAKGPMEVKAPERAKSPTYKPLVRQRDDHYGGVDVSHVMRLGMEIEQLALAIRANQLGPADIHQLTMTLQSGMPMETANALDTLSMISQPEFSRIMGIQLAECEHLLDALLELAEGEVEHLNQASTVPSATQSVPNFQKLFQQEKLSTILLQERLRPCFNNHELERSASRIQAIVLILRNLSMQDDDISQTILSDSLVTNFLISVLRGLASRPSFFCTEEMTLNIMKDMVILLSNTSTRLELASEEDAEVLLRFLVAFAPSASPFKTTSTSDLELEFHPYNPLQHQYLPYAIETLAKVLARDDPNRTFLKTIFQNETAASPPSQLLVGAFALIVAAIPDRAGRQLPDAIERQLARIRAPFMSMAMLCGDILASLAPSTPFESLVNGSANVNGINPEQLQEHGRNICDALLHSQDEWARNLAHFVVTLAYENVKPVQGPNGQLISHPYDREFSMFAQRGFITLRRLADKSHSGGDVIDHLLPLNDVAVGGLVNPAFDSGMLRMVMQLARADPPPQR